MTLFKNFINYNPKLKGLKNYNVNRIVIIILFVLYLISTVEISNHLTVDERSEIRLHRTRVELELMIAKIERLEKLEQEDLEQIEIDNAGFRRRAQGQVDEML